VFRVNIFNFSNTIVNYAHVLSRDGLVSSNDNFVIFKTNEVSKILQIGIFQIPINIVDVEVGLFYDNFSIALIYWNNDLLTQ